jgi:hypothetical protein
MLIEQFLVDNMDSYTFTTMRDMIVCSRHSNNIPCDISIIASDRLLHRIRTECFIIYENRKIIMTYSHVLNTIDDFLRSEYISNTTYEYLKLRTL